MKSSCRPDTPIYLGHLPRGKWPRTASSLQRLEACLLSQWAGEQLVGDEDKAGAYVLYKPTPPCILPACGRVTASPLKGAVCALPEQNPEASVCPILQDLLPLIPNRGPVALGVNPAAPPIPKASGKASAPVDKGGMNYLSVQIISNYLTSPSRGKPTAGVSLLRSVLAAPLG